MNLETLVQVSAGQVSCDLGGETAILNAETGVYYGLDLVGASVWKRMQQPITVGALRDAMLTEFEVDSATCERDLFTLLQSLAAEGLVQLRAEVPA